MTLCDAIRARRLVSFTYGGHHRVVIPAAHGHHKTTGNAVLRGYQIRGTSSSRLVPLWDLFRLDRMTGFRVLEETFDSDPRDYRRNDSDMIVHCQL